MRLARLAALATLILALLAAPLAAEAQVSGRDAKYADVMELDAVLAAVDPLPAAELGE